MKFGNGIDDEVLEKTDWTPLKLGGQNFKSHNLIKINPHRLEFRISSKTALFFIFMSGVGFLVLFLSMFGEMLGLESSGSPLYGGLSGLLFIIAGLFLYNQAKVKITLDKSYPALWKGNLDPKKVINPESIDGYSSLKKLQAVQLLEEYISRMNESADFVSYEINLVFEDGKRVHVIDHGDEASIFEQSNHLADFLSVPLWDGRHLEQEEDGLRIPSFVNRGLQLYKWGKTFIVLIIMGLLIWTTYKDLHRSNKEEASYQALSLQSKADMAEIYTNELFEAVVNRKYNVDRLNTLVKRGADVNKKDEKGRTPLFYAVLAKDITMINFLIRSYADIHTKDNQGVGLKDLLDIKKDQHLYFMLEDAALEEKASAQGKTISGISRTLDHAGNVTSVHVVYR